MATSAFKSKTSRRPDNPKPTQKGPARRSRSVSAFPRTHLDVTSDFQNKTDNPLFWVDGGSSDDDETRTRVEFSKFSGGSGESRRGSGVSRNSGCGGGGGGGGRSLSRVDTGRRRRSLSRGHYGNSEREDQETARLPSVRSESKISSNAKSCLQEDKTKLVRSASDLLEVLNGWSTWSSKHPASEPSDDCATSLSGSRIPHWDDGRSMCLLSEVEEKTIKPVFEEKKIRNLKEDHDTAGGILETVRTEVRRAISDIHHDFENAMLRSNSDFINSSIPSDVTSELADPYAVEFVSDIREEYTKELEECEKRTRKLRAELAVEEHRELELTQILEDIIPEPKTPQVQKPRAVRKASLERRKMSRCLEKEAMAYFDECVSISTFDDSDFSSLEDPPSSMVRFNDQSGENVAVPGLLSRADGAYPFETQGNEHRSLSANISSSGSPRASSPNSVKTKPQFTFSLKPSDTTSFQEDIRNYVKSFSKDSSGKENSTSHIVNTSHQSREDYTSKMPTEKYLLDRMTFRTRIESGRMVLCGGGYGLPMAPFSSVLW